MAENITVVGSIVGDPEQRALPGGGAVTSFRLACTHRRLDQSTATWVDAYTNWYNVSAFRGLGENAYNSFRKGDRVFVSGRFRLRTWEADGKKGVAADIEADVLGHDLLWGTTLFHRTQSAAEARTPAVGASADADAAPADADAAPSLSGEDAWAAPGAKGELVAVGDTPF